MPAIIVPERRKKMNETWQEEYRELLFGANHTEESIAKAIELKYNHMPKHLYKYRCFTDNHLSALKAGRLYATSTISLNDTKETNVVFSDNIEKLFIQKAYDCVKDQFGFPPMQVGSVSEIEKAISGYYDKSETQNKDTNPYDASDLEVFHNVAVSCVDQVMELLRKRIRSSYSVCCFSAEKDINSMWGLYADSHQGFCIEYDFKSLGKHDQKCAFLFPVLYVEDTRIIMNSIDMIDPAVAMLATTLKERKEWEQEKEWRIIYDRSEDGKPQTMPKPTAIYLGEKANKQNQIWMENFCRENSIPLYRMKYNQITDHIEPIVLAEYAHNQMI